MSILDNKLLNAFYSKRVIKVITGLHNCNIKQIIKVVKSAELSGAHYVDIIASPKVVKIIKSITNFPICVSSINPIDLYNCISAGADLVEIGNFSYFYNKGIFLSTDQILKLTKETLKLIKDRNISVTIPGTLCLSEQVSLAKNLEVLGVHMLQTEAYIYQHNSMALNSSLTYDSMFDSMYVASHALASTYAISKVVNIPIIASSGLSIISSSTAKFYGASGIGIGSDIRKKYNSINMVDYINELCYCVNIQNSSNCLLELSNCIKEKESLC